MFCVSLMLMTLVVTQLLLPAFRGQLLFPLFRSKLRKAERDLARQETSKRIKEMEVSTIRLGHENEQRVHEALDELIDDQKENTKER